MGVVVDPNKAFKVCHGYKIDHELILWSKGVIGVLSDDQERLCKNIIIENAIEGPVLFHSVEEALKAKVEPITPNDRQFVAIKVCAHMLDEAKHEGIIHHIGDVWAFMDYCMYKLGMGELKREIPSYIKEFLDETFKKEGVRKGMTKFEKLEKLASSGTTM